MTSPGAWAPSCSRDAKDWPRPRATAAGRRLERRFRARREARATQRNAGGNKPALRSRPTGQPCAYGSRRTASLAVAIVEGILIDQTENVGSFVIGSHHQLSAGRERPPQRFFLVAGWI